MKDLLRYLFLLFLTPLSLTACSGDDTTAVSYTAYNHTDKSIVSIIINGEGGILNVGPHGGGGGDVCCVVIPNTWRPGLKATIKWQEDGVYKRDAKGNIMKNDGVPIVIESPWKERTVEVPQYDDQLGQFQIHFFPHDEIKVVVSNFFPGHPKYPLTLPKEEGGQ
jgi:hypothetical protein